MKSCPKFIFESLDSFEICIILQSFQSTSVKICNRDFFNLKFYFQIEKSRNFSTKYLKLLT